MHKPKKLTASLTPDTLDMPAFSTRARLADLFAISERQIDRLVDAGEFPPPVFFGERSPRWPRDRIFEWLNSKDTGAD